MEIVGKVLIDEERIKQRVAELGAQITEDYRDKNLLVVCILRGGVAFMADLVKEIKLPYHGLYGGIQLWHVHQVLGGSQDHEGSG